MSAVQTRSKNSSEDSSVANPAVASLRELCAKSAAVAAWEVVVHNPEMIQYTHKWGTGHVFRCDLVSASDASEYVVGEVKKEKSNMKPLEAALAKFKPGLAFKMTKVCFNNDANKSHVHSSIKLSIDIAKTKMDALLADASRCAQPAPSSTCEDCGSLTTNQLFDITALVSRVAPTGNGGSWNGRQRVRTEFGLVDGSKQDGQKTREIPVVVFANKPTSGEAPLFQSLRKCLDDQLCL